MPFTTNSTRAIPFGKLLRNSCTPFPRGRTYGIPMGHCDWTFHMSTPTRNFSCLVRDCSHSRTGSLPDAVR